MTRYEYYIKEARGGKLRSEDLRIILIFGRNINYVNELEKQAKKNVDNKKKTEKKAKIKADALAQKAKLQIFALIGL